jgi:hypothetical protein
MTDQKPLQIGDTVEITGDRRHWLNGRRGVIVGFEGYRIRVQFDHIGRSREAMFLLENLVKVESEE